MSERIVLLISDLHIGSVWGIFPEKFKLPGGNIIELNPIQEELLRLWERAQDIVGDYDTVILLGDIVNGLNRHEAGKHVIVSDLNAQERASIKLLKPYCKEKQVFAISGSRYHNSDDYEIDKDIATHFGGHFGGAVANLKLEGTGKVINIRHGKGAMPMYTATKLEREINALLIAERLEKIPDIDGICMAHFHIYRKFEANGKIIVINHCWEGPRFNTYNSDHFIKYQPDIGFTKLIVNENGIHVIPYTFNLKWPRDFVCKV